MLKFERCSLLRRAVLSERGVSLYEALIAVALVGVGAAMVSQIQAIVPNRKVTLKRACDSHAQLVAVAIQEETYYRDILNFFPVGTTLAQRTASNTVSQFTDPVTRAQPTANAAWTSSIPQAFAISSVSATAVDGTTLRSNQLIQGSVRTLSSIYNNNAAVRCAYGAYAALTNIPPAAGALPMGADLLLRAPVVRIRIRPVNIVDGTNAVCAANLHLGPQGEYELNGMYNAFAVGSAENMPQPTAYYEEWVDPLPYSPYLPGVAGANLPGPMPVGARVATPGVTAPAGRLMRQDLGFALDVRVQYQNEVGALTEQCDFSQKFEYPRDRAAPPAPNIARVTANATSNNAAIDCQWPQVTSGATIQVGYDPTVGGLPELERGTQFLCRDLSWQKGFAPDPGPLVFNTTQCIIGGVRRGAVMARNSWPYYEPQYQDFSNRQNQWVPCDRLQQCNLLPTAVTFTPNNGAPWPTSTATNARVNTTGNVAQFYTLTYPTLPLGCVLNFEVIAVDTAGNTSVANVIGNRAFLEDNTAGITPVNEIRYSSCGTYVPGPVVVGPRTYNQGYFFCP